MCRDQGTQQPLPHRCGVLDNDLNTEMYAVLFIVCHHLSIFTEAVFGRFSLGVAMSIWMCGSVDVCAIGNRVDWRLLVQQSISKILN